MTPVGTQAVVIPVGGVSLDGDLGGLDASTGVVLFAHGSGSSRHSPRNRLVADELQRRGLATLLVDLLTSDEEDVDVRTRHLRFDIGLLADRLDHIMRWLRRSPATSGLPIGLFGASTGGAGALVAAARAPEVVGAVVSRGGRPDLAEEALAAVRAPTLLVVGGLDTDVLELNRQACDQMTCARRLEVVPGASHLFEEPGALAQVASLAGDWLRHYLDQ
jgi:putative phosphoribosyl transferase